MTNNEKMLVLIELYKKTVEELHQRELLVQEKKDELIMLREEIKRLT